MKNNIYIILTVFVIIGISLFIWYINRVAHLEPPVFKKIQSVVNKVVINGVGYPGGKVMVYIDNNFEKSFVIDDNGNFNDIINFSKEGKIKIKLKQNYKNIFSEFSDEKITTIDLTPPENRGLKIKDFPILTNKEKFAISGSYDEYKKYSMYINKKLVQFDDGKFNTEIKLDNGNNDIIITAVDAAGNKTVLKKAKIILDNIKPKFETNLYNCNNSANNLSIGEEFLCISTGEWEDWRDPAKIPITGWVRGKFRKITVDGKIITPDENNEIYKRIYLSVPKGLNKYKVIAEDELGNRTSFNLTMTVSSVDNNYDKNDEILDRLDDIESYLDY